MKLPEIVAALEKECGAGILKKSEFRGETTLTLSAEAWKPALILAREQLGFDMLLDASSVDNFGEEPRFELVYELYQISGGVHLRLKRTVSEDHLNPPPPAISGPRRTGMNGKFTT